MSNKAERRKSQLGSLSPVAPTSGRVSAEQPAPEQPASQPERATNASSKAGSRAKMGYYAAAEDSERIRAAFIAARNAGKPWRSLSEFQIDAILERVAQIEAELNGGRPFEGAPAHTLSPGRPLE